MIMQVDFLNCTCCDWETILQKFSEVKLPTGLPVKYTSSLEILN